MRARGVVGVALGVLAHYGRHVLAVEYDGTSFARTCRRWGGRIAVVRRDVGLTEHGVRRWCPA